MPQDYVASFSEAKGSEILHYGVPGMKWGQRKAKDHGSSTSNVARTGTGLKRGLVTDFTISPYRSVGRIKSNRATFDKLKPKQQSKLQKSLARDLAKASERKLDKTARGKTDYLAKVKKNPALRDQLIKGHASIFRFAKRSPGETKKQYLTTLSNWPRPLGWGQKTLNVGGYTLGVGNVALRGFSKHDALDNPDYVGAAVKADSDVEHFGVPGMKWGVRRSRSSGGSATPTRARAKEVKAKVAQKEGDRIAARINSINAGTGRPLVLNGKVLSRQQSVKHLERQAKRVGMKIHKVDDESKKKTDADTLKKHANEDAAKYDALKAKAKEKGPASLTDEELKFVNARTQALTKTQELFAKKDSLLKRAVKNAVDRALNESLKLVTDAGNKKLKDFIDLKTAAKPSPSSGSSKTKTPNGTYSILFGKPKPSPRPGPFGGPFRTTATQAGPGWPTSQGFANKPLGRAPLALPPGPVYKVTTL